MSISMFVCVEKIRNYNVHVRVNTRTHMETQNEKRRVCICVCIHWQLQFWFHLFSPPLSCFSTSLSFVHFRDVSSLACPVLLVLFYTAFSLPVFRRILSCFVIFSGVFSGTWFFLFFRLFCAWMFSDDWLCFLFFFL